MEGLLGIETGPKKSLFSLKSKKKFNAVLSGSTLTYTREGENMPNGCIMFTVDTIVEGSPKGKRLISIKNKNGEWDLVCPDATAYGKWMDAIALVFRELHVDPEKFSKMVNAAEEPDEQSGGHDSPTSHTSDSYPGTESANTVPDASDGEASSTSEAHSSDRPTPPPRPTVPERPTLPSRPNLFSSHGSDTPPRGDSKPEIPAKPEAITPRPEVPKRLDRQNSGNNLTKTPPPTIPRSLTVASTTTPVTGAAQGAGPSKSPELPSTAPPAAGSTKLPFGGGAKKLTKTPPSIAVPTLRDLSSSQSATLRHEPTSPTGNQVASPTGSLRLNVSRTQSVSTGGTNSVISPRSHIVSPRSGSVSGPPPPMPTVPPTAAPSSTLDLGKKFIVWMPNGLKHGSIFNADFTIRAYLDKICKTRDFVTPDTFIAKNSKGEHLNIDQPLSKIPGLNEIWWDTLAPGAIMPPDFGVSAPSASTSSSSISSTSSISSSRPAPALQRKEHSTELAPPADQGPPVDHRTKICREIISTERSYVDSLKTLQTGFIVPLTAWLKTPGLPSGQAPSSDLIQAMIPKNFDSIVGFNTMFLEELSKGDHDGIGALFMKYVNFLKIYNEYSSDYQASLGAYNKAMRDFPAFSSKLDELRAQTGSKLRVEDYIIMPVQRVPRYSLLIGDLLKNTPTTHIDYNNLQNAVQQLSDIGTFINESVRKSDGARRLREFEEKGVAVDRLITPSRFLVREGPVKVMEQKKKETKHFFLFNDILVQVKDSAMTKGVDLSLPEYVWPLNLIWITENDLTAEIVGPHGQAMSIKKKRADLTWLRDLNQRILALIQKSDPSAVVAGSKRIGAYTSPSDEQYDGEWLDGSKHGTGRSIVPGSVYEGNWEAGKRSGRGTITYSNGYRYVGEWKNDLQQGPGMLTCNDSDVIYQGSWVAGAPHGSGTMTYFPSGDVYVGDFYEGKCTGQGTLTYANGTKYVGQWLDDQFDVRGTLTSPEWGTYDGQFRAGLKSGLGTLTLMDGSKYVGYFLDGFRHGKGTLTEADGTTYEGEWIDDRPEGKGIKTWPDKVKYEGAFFRGVRKGVGKLFYPDGGRYEGNWLDDLPHGQGIYIGADSSSYTGEWVFGRREGKGVHIYASQAKYDGSWLNDRFHKAGTFLGGPGDFVKSYEGEWINGRISGKGTLQFQNGDSFKGAFKDGRALGAGIYSYSGGASFSGKWNLGQREGKGTYSLAMDDKGHGLSGSIDVSSNVLSTASLPVFLPPQQPLFLIAPAIEAIRLHRR